MGIIETLSAGFDTVRRKPWLILLPVALDIALWLGPKLSIVSMTRDLLRNLMSTTVANPEALSSLQETARALEQMAENIDLSFLLSSSLLGVPSLPLIGTRSLFGWTRQVIEVPGGLEFLALLVGLTLAGLLIGTFYLGLIAQQVREGRADYRRLARQLLRYWLRMVGAFALILITLTFLALPVSLVLSVFVLLSQNLGSLAMGLASFAAFWIMIYLAFVPQAILFGEDGVMRAIVHSITVVRTSFWSTLGLLLLINVITAGLMFIWQRLSASTPGAILAIAGNAFIGTGLTTAVFIFYRDRYQAWQRAARRERGEA